MVDVELYLLATQVRAHSVNVLCCGKTNSRRCSLALDIPMLIESDYSFVVVNDKMNRTMSNFISQHALFGFNTSLNQIIDLNPKTMSQAWHDGLPIQTLKGLLYYLKSGQVNRLIDCGSESITAQILAAKIRDADMQGPALQSAHVQVGEFLAQRLINEFGMLLNLVETVEYSHVQGRSFKGLRNTSTGNVLILPLMRGGEPLARGIYSFFTCAQFIHFYDQEEVIRERNTLLEKALGRSCTKKPVNIIITDSVINTGSSIKRAIHHIHKTANKISPNLQLVLFVVSGVMQQKIAAELPHQFPRVRFITLRVSANKYTGKGGTDTGNRLFGTTLLD